MEKIIAIAIDDILNNFSNMLNAMGITYDSTVHSLNEPLLKKCLYDIGAGSITHISEKAMGLAAAKQGAEKFMSWLHKNGWTIVLCTDRDLRFAYDITVSWLNSKRIYYDYIFFAHNMTKFCMDMNIKYLICNVPNISMPSPNLIYFCISAPAAWVSNYSICTYSELEEVKYWIQRNCFSMNFTQQSIEHK